MKDQNKAEEIAAARMQMLSPLLAEELDPAKARAIKNQICEQAGISDRTLRRYLAQYGNDGLEDLSRISRRERDRKDLVMLYPHIYLIRLYYLEKKSQPAV